MKTDFTSTQINTAFEAAGLKAAANKNADVFNIIRRGDISTAVGTLMAGSSIESQKIARAKISAALSGAV